MSAATSSPATLTSGVQRELLKMVTTALLPSSQASVLSSQPVTSTRCGHQAEQVLEFHSESVLGREKYRFQVQRLQHAKSKGCDTASNIAAPNNRLE